MPVIKQNPHPESAKKAKFPIILLVASTYGITISGTCLLGLLNQRTLILTAFCQSRSLAYYLGPTDGIKSVGFSQMLIESLFAAVILFAGIQSIRGLAKGILGYGFGSLCLGLSLMLYTLFKMTSEEYSVWASNIPQHLYSARYSAWSFGLVTTGMLTLGSRDAYMAWREENHGELPNRRR